MEGIPAILFLLISHAVYPALTLSSDFCRLNKGKEIWTINVICFFDIGTVHCVCAVNWFNSATCPLYFMSFARTVSPNKSYVIQLGYKFSLTSGLLPNYCIKLSLLKVFFSILKDIEAWHEPNHLLSIKSFIESFVYTATKWHLEIVLFNSNVKL